MQLFSSAEHKKKRVFNLNEKCLGASEECCACDKGAKALFTLSSYLWRHTGKVPRLICSRNFIDML